MQRTRGREALPPHKQRGHVVASRLTDKEFAWLQQYADQEFRSQSDTIRVLLNKAMADGLLLPKPPEN